MDILLRVIMVGSISSYGGSVVAPNSSAAYPQSDTISAASRVLQIMTVLLMYKEAEPLFRSKIADLMVLACSDDAVADFVCNKLLSHEPLAAAMTGLGLQAADAQSMADTDLFTM